MASPTYEISDSEYESPRKRFFRSRSAPITTISRSWATMSHRFSLKAPIEIPESTSSLARVSADNFNQGPESDPENAHTEGSDYESSDDENMSGRLQRDLSNAINANSKRGGEEFLPRNKLKYIVNIDSVSYQLEKCDRFKARRFKVLLLQKGGYESEARAICSTPTETNPGAKLSNDPGQTGYRKIMAILALIERPSKIRVFLEQGVSDKFLPFGKDELSKYRSPWKFIPSRRKASRDSDSSRPSESQLDRCFKLWRPETVAHFMQWQWKVIPHTFEQINDYMYNLITFAEHHKLPYTLWEPTMKGGSASEIYRVRIHARHHNFCSGKKKKHSKGYFVVKKLKSEDQIDFIREFAVLRRFSSDAHEHIVSLLATYKRGKYYYFLFPSAKYNLAEYWEKRGSPVDWAWMVQQCRGLANGLHEIHRYSTFRGNTLLDPNQWSGRATNTLGENPETREPKKILHGWHGDIKPENILWFPDSRGGGSLQLADFGVTQFDKSPKTTKRSLGHTATYCAPEFRPGSKQVTINSLCDIWALGCVYLEFLTWAVGGWELRQDFAKRRTVCDPAHYGQPMTGSYAPGKYVTDKFFITRLRDSDGTEETVVNPEVREMMEELRLNMKCSDLGKRFLDTVQKHMLVVDLGNDLGHVQPGRKCARKISLLLDDALSLEG